MTDPKKKLPKFEDWTPMWVTKGEDFDEDSAAKYIHTLLSDKEKLQGRVDAANSKVTEVEAERDEAKQALADADAKGADEKLTAATKRADEAEAKVKAAEALSLRYSVALDEGLTKVQAKRLLGSTEEELKSDAAELLESFGGAGRKAGDEDEEDEEGQVPTRTPKRLKNPGADLSAPEERSQADINKLVAGWSNTTGSLI